MSAITPTLKVFVWYTNGTEARCGHVAAAVSPTKNEDKENYIGFWPRNGLYVNPLTLPLASPGVSSSNLDVCMEREGDGENILKPDAVYEIKLSETEHSEILRLQEREITSIKNGKTLYSLFHNFNLVNAVQAFAKRSVTDQMQSCPMTGISLEVSHLDNIEKKEQFKVENCTTIVIKILQEGKIGVKGGKAPWGLTPSGLADQLDQLAKENLNIQKKSPKQRDARRPLKDKN